MRNNLTVFVVAALLVLATGTAVAQETTGGVTGSVSDEVGTPIAGAVIEAEGPYGTVSATTDDQGEYRFPRLTPGAYTVTAQLEGYAESSAEVRVVLGEMVTVSFALQRATFEQEVTVYSDTVAIDFTESATATSVREWEIDYLPRGRDFTDVVGMAAGAVVDNQAGGISIDGASGLENRYIIDGIDTTDPEIGDSAVPMRAEFMEEVQVKSAGYMAEYGGSTGGVINAVTRSGRNTWHGGVLVDYENMDWNGSARPQLEYAPCTRCQTDDEAESIVWDKDDEERWDPGIFLGGPIVRDYLWFFGSYQPGIRNRKRTVDWNSYPPDTYEQDFQVDYAALNLTANIASSLLLKLGANISPYETDGLLPNRDGKADLPGQENYAPLGQTGERETYSLTADWIATDNFVVSGRAGFYHTNVEDTGIPFFDIIHNYSTFSIPGYLENHGSDIPPQWQQNPGYVSDNLQTGVDAYNIYERTAGGIDASWYFRGAGDHALKFGFQREEIFNDVRSGYNADRILYYWDRTYTSTSGEAILGNYGYFRLLNISTFGEAETNNDALFVQDAWSVLPNLTLNIGLRAEKEGVPNYGATGPDPAISFDYGDKIAPRLGFAWDMFGDSKWKLYGSYGVYYDVTKYEMPRGSFGGDTWVDFFYTFDTSNPSLNDAATCRTGTNTTAERPVCPAGTLIEAIDRRLNSSDPANWEILGYPAIDPNMKPMESWEAQVGVDWQFTPKIQLGARYVHKEIERAIEDLGFLIPGIGEVYVIANPGEGLANELVPEGSPPYPAPVREYDGLELTMDRRFADNWSLRGYYRLSRLYGNYSGLANSDEQNNFGNPLNYAGTSARLSPNVSRLYDTVSSMYDANGEVVYGRLATDRTHQLGAQFLYSFNFGFSVGVNQYIGTGTPRSEIATVPVHSFFYPKGRGNLGETGTLTQTDLTLWQTFNLGRFDLSLGLTVLNLFDEDTVTRYWGTRVLQDLSISEEEFFQGFDYDTLVQEVDQDPAFNMPDTYQEPRVVRFTVKFEF